MAAVQIANQTWLSAFGSILHQQSTLRTGVPEPLGRFYEKGAAVKF